MRGRARAIVISRPVVNWGTVAAIVLAVLAAPAGAGAAEPPAKDPFYKPPAGFEATAPGTVLRSREVNLGGGGFGVKGFQLLFRSSNTFDEPIAAVTTYAVPPTPWTGVGQRPLVSYQFAIDGLGSQCNPSYQLQQGNSGEAETAAAMYAKGWAVNIPDHEGQDMEFVAGRNGAHITLDSIRALYNFAPAKVGPSNPLGVIGYSGGGQATAWTIEQQPSYAPELHIVAAAPGGIAVNLKEVAEYNNGGPGFGLVLAASLGIDRAFPELDLDELLNAEGKAAEQRISKECLSEYAGQYPNKQFSEFTKPEYAEPLSVPRVEAVLAADSLPKGVPNTPVFLWQSAADELIPVAGVDQLANDYCSQGVDVTYDRGASGEHVSFAVDNAPAAAAYLEAYFNGESVASTCGINASADTRIDSGPSGETAQDSATFTYSAAPQLAGETFECRLDGGEFESCPAAGITYTGLAGGQHSFAVRSITSAGNRDVSPATRSWTYVLPPTVTNVEPHEGPEAGGTVVTITGTNLSGASVEFGGSPATGVSCSPTVCAAESPAGTGTVDVTVTTTGGASATSEADRFTYLPAPAVTQVKPNAGPATGGTSVTITGTRFTGATAVRFGASSATSFTVKSATSIVARSPAGTGTVDVTVTTATAGTSAANVADQFRYLPAVTKVSPGSGPVGGGTVVTITGAGFAGATAVKFGSIEAAGFTVNSDTSITAVSPEEPAGTVDVRVTTPQGASPISAKDKFKFTPTITGVSPNTGSTAGGTSVTVTGSGFVAGTAATAFRFGTATATSVNCTTTTECVVVAPAHAAGKVHVRATVNKVTSPASSADLFVYR